jgi:hypothetical protein
MPIGQAPQTPTWYCFPLQHRYYNGEAGQTPALVRNRR